MDDDGEIGACASSWKFFLGSAGGQVRRNGINGSYYTPIDYWRILQGSTLDCLRFPRVMKMMMMTAVEVMFYDHPEATRHTRGVWIGGGGTHLIMMPSLLGLFVFAFCW